MQLRADKTEAVRTDHPHAVSQGQFQDAVAHSFALPAGFVKARRDYDDPRYSGLAAFVDDAGHGLGRGGDDREVDPVRYVFDRSIGLDALDALVLDAYGID